MKRRTGRPALLTDETSAQLLKDVTDGAYISTACAAAGISRQTFYNWLSRANEGREPYFSFFDALKKAEAVSEIFHMREMLQGGIKFLPHATFLERRHREKWGRSDRVAASPDSVPISLQVTLYGVQRHQVIEVDPITSRPLGPPKYIEPPDS